jgi:hypothetical protein
MYRFKYTMASTSLHVCTGGTTFVYVLSSDWLNYWFDTYIPVPVYNIYYNLYFIPKGVEGIEHNDNIKNVNIG